MPSILGILAWLDIDDDRAISDDGVGEEYGLEAAPVVGNASP